MTRDSIRAHLSWEKRSGVIEHVAVPELTSVERRGPEHRTRDSIEAHLNQEVRSKAAGHVTTPSGDLWRLAGLLFSKPLPSPSSLVHRS
jgi:hypothetical protein